MNTRAHLSLLAFCATLCACSFAPKYNVPKTELPAAYKEDKGWAPAQDLSEKPRGKWWEIYHDPALNALEEKVDVSNQSIKAALARYDEARAMAQYARADYFPQVTGSASSTRERTSQNVANARPVSLYNDHIVGADLSYELDLWGRVRNEVAAARGQAEASKADAESMALSMHAEMAGDYFALRGDDAAQDILDQTVTAYGKALELTRNRFNGGIAAEIDLDQAQTQLANAKTQAAEMHLKRQQLEHAIAVLAGEVPSSFTLAPAPLQASLPVIGAGLPSTLLQRRPDVVAAERRAYAANAQIGVARAAWFPAISLTGTFGFESEFLPTLLRTPAQFWTIGPEALFTLLDGGRINALSNEARAAYEEAAANYRQSVLVAFQDVEDSLVALHQLAQENVSQTQASDAANRVLAQANDRYNGGVVTYLDVVVAQNTALQSKLSLVDIRIRELTATTLLIKALGGGWYDAVPITPPPPATDEPKFLPQMVKTGD